MDYTEMEMSQLEERAAAIVAEAESRGSTPEDLEALAALEEESRAVNEEIERRMAAEAERRRQAEQIANGAGEIVNEAPEAREERAKKMSEIEIRNTPEYIDAYVDYLRTGSDKECRALLTENVSGTVAVPEIVYNIVKTAWERNGITGRVRRAYLKGNVKVNFEISSTGATVHTEGDTAVSEETLVLGTVNMIPKNIKKWIGVSDEVLDLRGEEFLRYIYDELTYQIAKKAGEELIDKIIACGTVGTTTQVGVPKLTSTTIGVGLIAQAVGLLSDEAENPVVIMNKATWAAFKAAQAANGYNYDPFEGMDVVFNNHVTPFATATTGVTYAIVGDLDHGALMNLPAGEEIRLNFDDKTLATQDINRVIGRLPVAINPVANNAFVKITH